MYTLIASATSGALANGNDTNQVTATLMNDNVYVSGAVLDFRIVSGSALFSNATQQITGSTSVLGEASVTFTDQKAETVTILAALVEDTTVCQTTSSTFTAADSSLTVTRVYNDNDKEFGESGPHYLFIGASFYIELSEISTSIVWSCDDPNVAVENVNGKGYVMIKGTPASNIIKITFTDHSSKGEYGMVCNLYLNNIHAVYKSNWPNEGQYRSIFNEWGDMTTFGWGTYYCFNYSDIIVQHYESMNMSTGTTGYEYKANFASIGVIG